MDLQRRISRMLAISGTVLMLSGVVAGVLIGDAAAAPQEQPPEGRTAHADHADHTTTTSDGTTSTTRKRKSAGSTTTTEPTTTTSGSPAKAPATTAPPSTTTTAAPTTTTTATSTTDSQAPNPDRSAAQVGATTSSTTNAPISRGPKSPVIPPQNPPAEPVTSTTVADPIPPAPVANPLPRTPVTALSGPPPNPLSLEAVQESAPPVGPPVPPWDTQTTTPESENARRASGAATQTPGRRPSSQLGMTGSATRTLLFLAGIALLLGAIAVALGEPGPRRAARATAAGPEAAKAKPKARTRRLRRTIPGWESGVPLAPTRRATTRARLERRGRFELRPRGGEPAA